jgi:hypothetical protein
MSPIAMVMRGRTAVLNRFPVFDETIGKRSIITKISYFLLQQLDLLLTLWAVNAGFTELNPMMRGLLASPPQLVLFKVIIPMMLAWFCPSKLLLPSLALILAVTLWNVKELIFLIF